MSCSMKAISSGGCATQACKTACAKKAGGCSGGACAKPTAQAAAPAQGQAIDPKQLVATLVGELIKVISERPDALQ